MRSRECREPSRGEKKVSARDLHGYSGNIFDPTCNCHWKLLVVIVGARGEVGRSHGPRKGVALVAEELVRGVLSAVVAVEGEEDRLEPGDRLVTDTAKSPPVLVWNWDT